MIHQGKLEAGLVADSETEFVVFAAAVVAVAVLVVVSVEFAVVNMNFQSEVITVPIK